MADDFDAGEVRARMAEGALRGLAVAGEDLLGEAQRRAPIDKGDLRGSGMLTFIVNGARFEGDGAIGSALAAARAAARAGTLRSLDAEVSFNTVYAARQHEETEWLHPLDGEAKYLERPLVEKLPRYERVVAGSIGRAV